MTKYTDALPLVTMDRREFDDLNEYSASYPTGVTLGKRWRRHDGAFDPSCPQSEWTWLLCEYVECPEDPGYLTVKMSRVRFLDEVPKGGHGPAVRVIEA